MALGRALAALGRLLGALARLLGASWLPLGRSWAPSGWSWAPLGSILALLEASGFDFSRFWEGTDLVLEAFGGSFCHAFCVQSLGLHDALIAAGNPYWYSLGLFIPTCSAAVRALCAHGIGARSAIFFVRSFVFVCIIYFHGWNLERQL